MKNMKMLNLWNILRSIFWGGGKSTNVRSEKGIALNRMKKLDE